MKKIHLTRLIILLVVMTGFVTVANAQRVWHLNGDSVGPSDYIGSNNTEDLRISTDSTVRLIVRGDGDIIVERNIIDSTGYLRIDSIRARVIHVGDSSLVLGTPGFTPPGANTILANNGGTAGSGSIILGHTGPALLNTNLWNIRVGIGTSFPQTKLQLNTDGNSDCFALFTNNYDGGTALGPGGGPLSQVS